MSNRQPGDPDSTDSAMIVVVAVVVIAIISWILFHTGISGAAIALRSFQMDLIGLFYEPAAQISDQIKKYNPEAIDFSLLSTIMKVTGDYTKWFYSLIAMILLVVVFFGAPLEKYKRVHTMQSLKDQEVKIWPFIAPTMNLELVKGDITKGKWAVSQTEREFVTKHGLLNDKGEVIEEKARQVFSAQIGRPWRGYADLKPYEKGVFASLLLYIHGERKVAEKHLGDIALAFNNESQTPSFKEGAFDFADSVYEKYADSRYLKGAVERHYYVYTVFAILFQLAKIDGVAPSSLCVWLKPTDRRLWYTLNAVGSYSFFVECAGVMSHWLAEKSLSDPIITPTVKSAVDGLKDALLEFCEDDELERIYK